MLVAHGVNDFGALCANQAVCAHACLYEGSAVLAGHDVTVCDDAHYGSIDTDAAIMLRTLGLSRITCLWARMLSPHPDLPAAVRCVAFGRDHALMCTVGGRLYAMGRNTHAQLGIAGYTGDAATWQPVPLPHGAAAVHCYAGPLHSAVIDDRGSLYLFGDDSALQCSGGGAPDATASAADATARPAVRSPLRWTALDGVPGGGCVRAAACGSNFTWILTTHGQVYQQGRGPAGGSSSSLQVSAVAGLPECAITAIACGYQHGVALDDAGQVWTVGRNCAVQMSSSGEWQLVSCDAPRCLPLAQLAGAAGVLATGARVRATAISAGRYHTVSLLQPISSLAAAHVGGADADGGAAAADSKSAKSSSASAAAAVAAAAGAGAGAGGGAAAS